MLRTSGIPARGVLPQWCEKHAAGHEWPPRDQQSKACNDKLAARHHNIGPRSQYPHLELIAGGPRGSVRCQVGHAAAAVVKRLRSELPMNLKLLIDARVRGSYTSK